MTRTNDEAVIGYGLAVVAMVVMAGGLIDPLFGTDPRELSLVLVVMLCARFGGFGAGLVAMAGGVLVLARGAEAEIPSTAIVVRLGRFVALGLLSCTGVGSLLAAWRRIRATTLLHWRADGMRYRRLVEDTGGGIWEIDDDGRTTYANRRLGEILGVPPRHLDGRRWQDFVIDPEPDLDRWVKHPASTLVSQEFRLRRSDGEHLAAIVSARPIVRDALISRQASGTGALLLTVTDVTPLKRAEAALRVESELMSVVLDTTRCLIVVLDRKGEILRLNETCRSLIGQKADGAVGQKFWDVFLPPEEADHDREMFERLEAGGPPLDASHWRIRNGHARQIAWSNATLAAPWGGVEFVVATGIDVTELKAIETELSEAKERAEAANQAKDRFLAVLSHELRTPLTPVLIAVSTMLENTLEPALFADLEMIRHNVLLEARLIDDLLDVALIGRGQLRLEPEVVDFHEAIHRGLEICRDETRGAGLRIETDLSARCHHVLADRARVMQMIWNLIRNAARFIGSDGGTLTIRTTNTPGPEGGAADGASRPHLLAEFADTGVGMDREEVPRIFEPFEQGASGRRGRSRGLGLGLSISRSLIEAHGGRISAASPGSGLGSTFSLELETIATPVAAGVVSAPEMPDEATTPTRLRVLLVEDNKDILRYLADGLSRQGHEVVAADGMAAARAAFSGAEAAFDLLVSDIELPDGNGYELMRDFGSSLMPGLAISGYGSEEDVRESLKAGFSEHLTKPLDTRRLLDAVQRVMAGAGRVAADEETVALI